MSERHMRWVRDGQHVRAFTGFDRALTECEGEVVGYQESPTVFIRTASGQIVTWAAHLTEENPVEPPEN